ncbi:MAG TPA: hypothetical protein VGM93_05095, partial [Acidimicrobiales bacterium]
MCGIIAVLRRRSDRATPTSAEVLGLLEGAPAVLATAAVGDVTDAVAHLAERVDGVDRLLRGTPGVRCLLADRSLAPIVDGLLNELAAALADIERGLDEGDRAAASLEATNAAIVHLKDAIWAVQRDRLPAARAVADL